MDWMMHKTPVAVLLLAASVFLSACETGLGTVPVGWEIQFYSDSTCRDVAVGPDDSVYVLGTITGVHDLDPGQAYEEYVAHRELGDIILVKYDSHGGFLWARTWGGADNYYSTVLAVDAAGSLLITGRFSGTLDMDPGEGVDERESASAGSAFLVKLDSSGNLQFALTSEGAWQQVVVDSAGSIYLLGGREPGSHDLDPGPGTDVRDFGMGGPFLTKLERDGGYLWSVLWPTPMVAGYAPHVGISCVAVGAEDNVYLSGSTTGGDLDPGPGESRLSASRDGGLAFVMRLSPDGEFVGAGTWGDGSDNQSVWGIDINSQGTAFIVGTTYHRLAPPGAAQSTLETRAFLASFDSDCTHLNTLVWDPMTRGSGIMVDSRDFVHVYGSECDLMDLDPGPRTSTWSHTMNGQDITGGEGFFYVKFSPGGRVVETKVIDFDSEEKTYAALASDSVANLYIVGNEEGCGFLAKRGLALFGEPRGGDGHRQGEIEPPAVWTVSFGSGYMETMRPASMDLFGSGATMGPDNLYGLGVDSLGNAYVAGVVFTNTDLDPGSGKRMSHTSGQTSGVGFLSKFSPDGKFEWARTWDKGIPHAIAINSEDEICVTGMFAARGFDLDPGPGVDERSVAGSADGFVCKISADGNYRWGRTFGNRGTQAGDSIAVDPYGNIFITGNSRDNRTSGPQQNSDFNPVPGTEQGDPRHDAATFLLKLNPRGELVWTHDWPGGTEYAHVTIKSGVAAGPNGNVYLASYSGGQKIDFDPGPGVEERLNDIYLLSLDGDGVYRWVWTSDNAGSIYGLQRVAVDSSGNVYLCGHQGDTRESDAEPLREGPFAVAFDWEGNELWSRTWPPESGRCEALDLAVGPSGIVYLTGQMGVFSRYDLPRRLETGPSYSHRDVFVRMFDPATSTTAIRTWGRLEYTDSGRAIAADASGRVYVAGLGEGLFLTKLSPESEW